MEKNNFLKKFLIIGVGTIVNMLLGLITTPLITRIVDPTEYGKLSIFTLYSNIAVMTLCLGLDQALVRYYYESDDFEYKKKLLFQCIKFPVITSVIISIIVIILSYLKVINFEFNTFLIVLLCIYTIIQIIYRFSLLLVRLDYKSKLYSLLQILNKLFYVVIAIVSLFYLKKWYLTILVLATIISAFICLLISIFAQINIWNFFSTKDNKNNISVKELIKYSYPFIVSLGLTTLFQGIDKICLNYFCDYYEVGIYASTLSLINIFAIIQSTFNSLWGPLSVEHYTKFPNDKKFYQTVNQLMTFIMFFIGISLIFVKDIFSFLLGEKYRLAAYILPFLIFNPIMYTLSETTGCGLVFMKKSKYQVIVSLIACACNILGNIILVPMIGSKGAAISTGISYIVFFSLKTFLSNRFYYVNYKLKKFYILTFIVCVYAWYNTFYSFNFITVLTYIICIVILCILYFDCLLYIINYLKVFLNKKIFKKNF